MNEKRPYVLFLPRWYPNRFDPMPGLFIRRHAEAAAKYCKIAVLYVHAGQEVSKGYQIEQTHEPDLHTLVVYYPASTHKLLNILRFFRANAMGLQLLSKANGLPDVVHVHVLTRLALIAWWYRLRFSIPYLITEHWSRYIEIRNDYKGFWRKLLTRFLVGQAAMVTTVTRNLAEAMKQHGLHNKHYRILPNVVDTSMFVNPVHKQDWPRRIIHVSCFEDRSKNISGMLRAIASLAKLRTDFSCLMVGDGMDFENMKRLASQLGLDSIVYFTGLLEGRQLAITMASGHFLVLFSNYENLPVVIPEAMACGLPVVATKVGGIAEVIDESNGILVEPGNEKAFMQAMNIMLDRCMDYNPYKLREKVTQNNSPAAVGHLLYEWYLEILGKRISFRASNPYRT